MNMRGRFEELDSIRGLAATSVILSHLFLVVPRLNVIDKIKNTPLHIFWAGHEAVILFFILSGFVLSLPFYTNRTLKYKEYLIKRSCRIYIPYVISILLAIILMNCFSSGGIPDLSKWFNTTWTQSLSGEQFLNHILMLGDFQSYTLNTVIWSIVHEMRISIIFPFLMYLIVYLNWKKSIGIGIICSILCLIVWYISINFLNYNVTKYDTSYVLTIHYIGFFIIGALLAKHRQFFHVYYNKLSKGLKLILAVVGVSAYTYSWWFFPNIFFLHLSYISDWIVAIGSSIFIIYTLNSKTLHHILLLKPIHFIGKISYSIYLFHMSVLLTLVNVLHGKMSIGVILLLVFIIAFVVASMMYYLVEKPSIKFGKFLTKKRELITLINKKIYR